MLDPRIRAELDQIRSQPKFKERQDRLLRINARGPLAVAITDQSLPDGVIGYAYLGQQGNPARYALFSVSGFDDDVYMHVMSVAVAYQMAHEEDRSAVKLTVHGDGAVEIESAMLGRFSTMQRYTSRVADRQRVTGPALRRLASVKAEVLGSHSNIRILRPERSQ